MHESLFNRASKNFEQYLKDFKTKGIVHMLPIERLSSQEWQTLNDLLAQHGVCMVKAEYKGYLYMRFSKAQNHSSKDFGEKLKKITGVSWEHKTKENTGLGYEHYRIRIDNLAKDQVQPILDALDTHGIYGADAVYTNKGQFLIIAAPSAVQDYELQGYKTVKFNGVPAYIYDQPGMGHGDAQTRVARIIRHGEHYAVALNKSGHSGADYIVIAMKRADAEKLGFKYDYGYLSAKMDNSAAKKRLLDIIGKPLMRINGMPVMIKSKADFGILFDRPVVLVSVGEKKLPFYISSGSAGKTDVPAGKWEFFGGIDSNDWFRKGTLNDILSHYNSVELKQIADMLDANIGDLRDTIDVLKTIGRKYLGGVGNVARMMHGPQISRDRVNQDVCKNEYSFYSDLNEIKDYLSCGARDKDITQGLNKGTKNIKSGPLSRFVSWFKDDEHN